MLPDESRPGSGLECSCYDDASDVFEGDLEGSETPAGVLQNSGLTGGVLHNSSLLLEKARGTRSTSAP